jgi:hypothetical protein
MNKSIVDIIVALKEIFELTAHVFLIASPKAKFATQFRTSES